MSIPFIIPGFGTRERAITDIIESTALQKTALAHIINAEWEKIQATLLTQGFNSAEVLEVNESVISMLYNITRLELILEGKLTILPDLSVFDTFFPEKPSLPLVPLESTSTDKAKNSSRSGRIDKGNSNSHNTDNFADDKDDKS